MVREIRQSHELWIDQIVNDIEKVSVIKPLHRLKLIMLVIDIKSIIFLHSIQYNNISIQERKKNVTW